MNIYQIENSALQAAFLKHGLENKIALYELLS